MSDETPSIFPHIPAPRQRAITKNTTAAFTLGTFVGISTMLLTVGWKARDFVQIQADTARMQADATRETNSKLEAIRSELVSYSRDAWTLADMERWVGRFRWENRNLNLSVNEPRESRR